MRSGSEPNKEGNNRLVMLSRVGIWGMKTMGKGRGPLGAYLLHLSCSAPEEFNVSLTQHALVPAQCSLCQFLTSKECKGITSGPAIRVAHKEQTVGTPSHRALWPQETQNICWPSREGQSPKPQDHLVFP